ncbi:MAG: hypothetical protein WCK18_13800 [Prolixibacteraceae bacterium]
MLMDRFPDHFTIMFDEFPDKNYRDKSAAMALGPGIKKRSKE